jgi:hypothetical protein
VRPTASAPRSRRGATSSRATDDLEAAVELLDETPDAELEAEIARDAALADGLRARADDAALLRRARRARGDPDDQRRSRRHRGDRLGRDAPAHVPALGRSATGSDRDRRPAEGEQAGLKSVTVEVDGRRLRLAARRARRPPPGPDQPVRLAEAAPDDVRPGRGPAGGRRRRRDRARLGRDPGRHLPGVRAPAASTSTRPTRPSGSRTSPPASSCRARTSDRRPRTRRTRSRSSRPASSSGSSRRRRRDARAQGRARRGRLGQPDPQLRPPPLPDGQGPPDRAHETGTRARSSTATSTRSCRPSWSVSPPGRPASADDASDAAPVTMTSWNGRRDAAP